MRDKHLTKISKAANEGTDMILILTVTSSNFSKELKVGVKWLVLVKLLAS